MSYNPSFLEWAGPMMMPAAQAHNISRYDKPYAQRSSGASDFYMGGEAHNISRYDKPYAQRFGGASDFYMGGEAPLVGRSTYPPGVLMPLPRVVDSNYSSDCSSQRSDAPSNSSLPSPDVRKGAQLDTFIDEPYILEPSAAVDGKSDTSGSDYKSIQDVFEYAPNLLDDSFMLSQPPPPPGLEGFTNQSEGSMGHPFSCGLPCKYRGTPRGCKDGETCQCCHQCKWCPWMKTRRGRGALLGSKAGHSRLHA